MSIRRTLILLRARFLLVIIVAIFPILQSVSGNNSLGERLTINNFKLGGIDYLIVGDKAIVTGDRALIKKMQGVFHRNNSEMRLFSPECDFDQVAKTGQSSSRIHLRSKSLTIDGVGFDLDFAAHRVFIRDEVKVRIFTKDKQLLGE